MADSNIGALPQAVQLEDDSLLVAEQQGQAVKVTGAQFKEFGRQAVVGQVQGYVDQAQAAAEDAVSAVEAVTGMTVEAHPGETASVSKSTRDGKVHLTFGLPRGAQGIPGPEGPAGPRGARGETGKGLDILGYYDAQTALETAVTAPEPGDAYGVGTEAPFDIYVFDSVSQSWKNNGPLSGGGGIVPENVVTSEGGAVLEVPDSFGETPHTIQITDEEELPLTAEDIVYQDASVAEAIEKLFTCVSEGKALLASALTDRGVLTEADAAFAQLAEHIRQISGGSDTSDADAQAWDILAGKTAYSAHGKVEGVIPSLEARTYTPGMQAQTIANGQYLSGVQTIQGDPNLTSGNIKKGVSIFGVAGAVEQSFLATLTVTADVGAVVTATHTSGAEVEALSVTGAVTLELPLEGAWTVTARRGVAQYNSVLINVTSQYSASLTAEVHIVRYGTLESLSLARYKLAAATVGIYAIFASGFTDDYYVDVDDAVDVFDENYTHSKLTGMRTDFNGMRGGAEVGNHALFAGSAHSSQPSNYSMVESYDDELTLGRASDLSVSMASPLGISTENHALFAGAQNTLNAYDKSLTRTTPDVLALPGSAVAGASNNNYTLIGGGENGVVTAYDQYLTRTLPPQLSIGRTDLSAARAGNYILFAGGAASGVPSSIVDAYDLFLTRSTAQELSATRLGMAAATLLNFALFAGGRTQTGYDPTSGTSTFSADVDVYDSYLTRIQPEKGLGRPRAYFAAAAIGNSAIFAGGMYSVGGSEHSIRTASTSFAEAYRYI